MGIIGRSIGWPMARRGRHRSSSRSPDRVDPHGHPTTHLTPKDDPPPALLGTYGFKRWADVQYVIGSAIILAEVALVVATHKSKRKDEVMYWECPDAR